MPLAYICVCVCMCVGTLLLNSTYYKILYIYHCRYEMMWPGHCITVTPDHGILQPRYIINVMWMNERKNEHIDDEK